MRTLWQDVRYGLRLLAGNPGFAVVVVLILAVGIGANTAVFSVVNAVMLRPLPYADAHRLVTLMERPRTQETFTVYGRLLLWREQNQVFERTGRLYRPASLRQGNREGAVYPRDGCLA